MHLYTLHSTLIPSISLQMNEIVTQVVILQYISPFSQTPLILHSTLISFTSLQICQIVTQVVTLPFRKLMSSRQTYFNFTLYQGWLI